MAFHNSNETLDRHPASMVIGDADSLGTATIGSKWNCDPLDPDAIDDVAVTTTSRRLVRLAIAAADAGARFAREGLDEDPAAWMLTPRVLFDGLPPIDACQQRGHFTRSVVLHSLGLGLDADPRAIDALLDEEDDDADGDSVHDVTDHECDPMRVVDEGLGDSDPWSSRLPRPELLTC
ncbi:MAG TPA: hypothetical protein VNJ03_09475 [Vicinamibacterales bacterium]|nr:hypothetical protein [Vicinamibacterales bacterium]